MRALFISIVVLVDGEDLSASTEFASYSCRDRRILVTGPDNDGKKLKC
jgi:hypothetical protein